LVVALDIITLHIISKQSFDVECSSPISCFIVYPEQYVFLPKAKSIAKIVIVSKQLVSIFWLKDISIIL